MTQVKKLILDYSKWRSGDNGPNKTGDGPVALLNHEGWMCCLGQWCEQLGATKNMLIGCGEPEELRCVYDPFTYDDSDEYDIRQSNTKLSNKCMEVNDEAGTTPDEKIEALRSLLGDYHIELEVINKL